VPWLIGRETSRSGKNNYKNYNCYRDNNHDLYNDGHERCWSVYYCLAVSLPIMLLEHHANGSPKA
jgi:hypothetical protein